MEGYTNAADFILARLAKNGNKIAQVHSRKAELTLKNGDVCHIAEKVACLLESESIGPGQRVAICAKNCLQYAGVLLGVLKAGATAALFPPNIKPRELEHIISVMKPSRLYAPKLNQDQLKLLENHPDIVLLKWSLEELLENDGKSNRLTTRETTPDQYPALLLSSSGSTGLPKAVCISHTNIMWSILKISGLMMKEDETALGLMPFYHAYGLGLMLMALYEGSPLVVMSKYTLQKFSSTITRHEVKLLHVVASFMNKLLNEIDPEFLNTIKAVYTGAGAVLPKHQVELIKRLRPGARLYHSYGMTETTHVACLGEMRDDKPGSPGSVIPCLKAKIIGNNGETLTAGDTGELCLSGPLIMSGYFNNAKATEESFTEDGWLRTGDLAWMDEDGYVYIVDRIKDIIKFQGYQISVTELEHLICEQPGVAEVAVVGVPHEQYGEVPRAFVVAKDKIKPSEEQIIEAVKRELSYYKWLRGGVWFLKSLPKTHNMKIYRKELRYFLR